MSARYRARPSLTTLVREFRAANEAAEWSRRGLTMPTWRGRHCATDPTADPAATIREQATAGLDDVADALAHRLNKEPS